MYIFHWHTTNFNNIGRGKDWRQENRVGGRQAQDVLASVVDQVVSYLPFLSQSMSLFWTDLEIYPLVVIAALDLLDIIRRYGEEDHQGLRHKDPLEIYIKDFPHFPSNLNL